MLLRGLVAPTTMMSKELNMLTLTATEQGSYQRELILHQLCFLYMHHLDCHNNVIILSPLTVKESKHLEICTG